MGTKNYLIVAVLGSPGAPDSLDLRGWPGRFCGEGGVLGDGLAAKSVRVAQPQEVG